MKNVPHFASDTREPGEAGEAGSDGEHKEEPETGV